MRAILKHPWRLMIVVNAAVMFGVFLHKITLPPFVPYIHLLVDYQFGLIKRALIGLLSSASDGTAKPAKSAVTA